MGISQKKTFFNAEKSASPPTPPRRFGRTFLRRPNIFKNARDKACRSRLHPFFKMLTSLKNLFVNPKSLDSWKFSDREVFKGKDIGLHRRTATTELAR